METGVFFVVEKIPTIWNWHIGYFLGAIFITVVFFFWENICKIFKKQTNSTNKKGLKIANISDEKFFTKNLRVLQKFISQKYMPKNAIAHSYDDIAKYCNNEKLLKIYREIEIHNFNPQNITEEQKKNYYTELHSIIFSQKG